MEHPESSRWNCNEIFIIDPNGYNAPFAEGFDAPYPVVVWAGLDDNEVQRLIKANDDDRQLPYSWDNVLDALQDLMNPQ